MFALILCLLADPEPSAVVKPLARGTWPAPKFGAERGKPKGIIARSAIDVVSNTFHVLRVAGMDTTEADATRDLANALKVKSIDWKKQMAVAVLGGQRGSNAYRVEITGLYVEKGTLKVSWMLHKGPRGGDDVITHPSACVLIPRHDGKVVFDPPIGK